MRFLFLPVLLLTAAATAQAKAAAKTAVDFEKQIWPILEKNCVECHSVKASPDGRQKKPKGGVTLDGKDTILSSKKGKLFVAKKPDDSLLFHVITLAADHEDRMPPAKKGEPLAKEQTDLIKQWIEEGASFGKWVGKKADGKAGDKGKEGDKDGDKEGGDKPKGKEPGKESGDKPKPPEPPHGGG